MNCAGLRCDRVALLAGERDVARIIPFRGEYYQLRPEAAKMVRNLIYPVPDPSFPFLGVHFTRLIGGGVQAGPNAVLALAREGYSWRPVNVLDLANALGYLGLWRFLHRNAAMSWGEITRYLSRQHFCAALQKLVPGIRSSDLVAGGAGVRAQALLPGGSLLQDFHFVQGPLALTLMS